MKAPHPALVVGLGNPILGDDGVGWRVAEALRGRQADVEVLCLSLGGLALMERLEGYQRCVIVDAVVTGAAEGHVQTFTASELADASSHHTASVHDLGFAHALRLGREIGVELPDDILVVGIEAAPEFTFGEQLSPAVEDAIPRAIELAERWLTGGGVAPR